MRCAHFLAEPHAPLGALAEPAALASGLAGVVPPAGHEPGSPAGGESVAGSAGRIAQRLARCARALLDAGAPPDRPACALFVPGRIEVLGKHTDYAGGRSLLAAVEQGIALVATARPDARVRIRDLAHGVAAALELSPDLAPAPGEWSDYPRTVARRLARDFPHARRGADIAFESDLPPAAGLSSSSALVVACGLALGATNALVRDDAFRAAITCEEDLADYLSAVENGRAYRGAGEDRGVGTEGGGEDHTAVLCARAGALVQYAFLPTRFEGAVPLPAGCVFAVGASGVHAAKAGNALEHYNRLSRQARRLAELWREGTGRGDETLGAALDGGPAALERLRGILGRGGPPHAAALLARLEQFAAETRELIPAAAAAVAAGDLDAFGAAVDRSQALAERALGNQVEETVFLARSARELGAAAASAFGAGFGGSVWALVREEDAAPFLAAWREAYLARFPQRAADARFFTTRAGTAALRAI